jgi:glycosyltransferase involved in cell wall biosynthesis
VRRLSIALVVQGRFHAFDLARGLARRGHEVVIFTNYPAWAAARFDIRPAQVRSAWAHGAVVRALPYMPVPRSSGRTDVWLHQTFGRWAARALEGRSWDVVHCWSGVSEELLRSDRIDARCRLLMRGSAHIAVQDQILRDEEARTGAKLDRPSPWMVAREIREYALADRVLVLSDFARRSFESQGYPSERLLTVPLGVDVQAFRPARGAVAARARRIKGGQPLRVLYAGALSLRKGLWDLAEATRLAADVPFELRLAGTMLPEAGPVVDRMAGDVVRLGKIDQSDLPAVYGDADLFVFPTLEDGFGMVLTQAKAAGLPVLCTDHCAGPDLIREGVDGWVVPIRAPEALAARLRWCHEHRDQFAAMADNVATAFRPRDWSAVAEHFERLVHEELVTRPGRARPA